MLMGNSTLQFKQLYGIHRNRTILKFLKRVNSTVSDEGTEWLTRYIYNSLAVAESSTAQTTKPISGGSIPHQYKELYWSWLYR